IIAVLISTIGSGCMLLRWGEPSPPVYRQELTWRGVPEVVLLTQGFPSSNYPQIEALAIIANIQEPFPNQIDKTILVDKQGRVISPAQFNNSGLGKVVEVTG